MRGRMLINNWYNEQSHFGSICLYQCVSWDKTKPALAKTRRTRILFEQTQMLRLWARRAALLAQTKQMALPQKSDPKTNFMRGVSLNLRSRCKHKAWGV